MEDHLIDIFATSESEGEMKIKMDNLTAMIEFAESIKEKGDHAATGDSSLP